VSPLLEIPYPRIDPVLIQIGPVAVRWYGIAFLAAFLIARSLLLRLAAEGRLPLSRSAVADLIFACVVGTVLGGRLGYVLIYNLHEYLARPLEVLAVWKGGLSFHGGLAGVALALLWTARRHGVPFLALADAGSLVATPGIFCVRVANFINGELWGRPTELPWAMRFPAEEAGGLLRHPSQLYEAFGEGALLFALLWGFRNRPFLRRPGRLSAAFLGGYACVRFLIEFTRQPDAQIGFLPGSLTMGQVLCALMFLASGVVVAWTHRPPRTSP
jgi:phosphatidylglycerol:prolipoprotein diacylglycerol transferase